MKLHTGICKFCNQEYSRPRPLRSEYCSKKCSKQARRIIDKRNCLNCRQEFKCDLYIKKDYCSIVCFNKVKKMRKSKTPMVRICEMCGNSYKRAAGNLDQKYCSKNCMNQAPKVSHKVICIMCAKEKILNSHNYNNQITCSKSCGVKYGNILKKGSNFITTRMYKRERLLINPSCEKCGWNEVPEILEVHHRDRNRKNSCRENYELICPNCHSIDHYKARDGQFAYNLGRKKIV